MTGLYTPSMNVLCKKEVLGCTYDAKIAGIDVQLCFPHYPVGNKEDCVMNDVDLEPPMVASGWKRGDKELSWGYPMRYPSGDSCVGLLAMIVPETDGIENQANALYRGIDAWDERFIEYLVLVTKQHANRETTVLGGERRLELLGPRYIPNHREIVIQAHIYDEEAFASGNQIKEAIEFASSEKDLFLEYQMMLLSYLSRWNDQNRPAIVDACSALEISLVKFLEKRLTNLGYDKEWYLEHKFRSLGDRLRLAENLDKTFPDLDYNSLVVKPRNDLAHNRETFPSDETTNQLIHCVEVFLEHYNGKQYY